MSALAPVAGRGAHDRDVARQALPKNCDKSLRKLANVDAKKGVHHSIQRSIRLADEADASA
jgi:hypothetical protein